MMGPFVFDFRLLLFLAPALLLAFLAQMWVKAAYARASAVPAFMSGAQAARKILDAASLHDVGIEEVRGFLSDHYDPRDKVLRLSSEVFHGRTAAAIGIAAHEAGHALQDAHQYLPLVVRNAAVPLAGFGSNIGLLLAALGVAFQFAGLILVGVIVFSGVVFFQLVNLPVEFNASSRAKEQLVMLGIAGEREMPAVRGVLTAAAMTYVAATLQAVLYLAYYLLRYFLLANRGSR